MLFEISKKVNHYFFFRQNTPSNASSVRFFLRQLRSINISSSNNALSYRPVVSTSDDAVEMRVLLLEPACNSEKSFSRTNDDDDDGDDADADDEENA